MATSYAKHGFNDLAYARLRDDIAATATVLRMGSHYIYQFNKGWAADREMYITLTDVACNVEVCKVTAIVGSRMTIERGQDGTVARAWTEGALICQRLVAANLGRMLQEGEFKTIDYNPNGVLTPDYPNEKVYETGAHACQKKWWIHGADNKWRLLAGAMCDWEYYDDGWIYEMPQLFCFGGLTDHDATDQFCPGANAWAERTNIYANKMGAAAASPSGSGGINLFGGGTTLSNSTQDNLLWQTNLTYAVKVDIPSPARSAHMAVGSYGDFAYCFGGIDFGTPTVLSDNDRYSETGDSWLGRQAVPGVARMAGGAGSIISGNIYYTGGDSSGYAHGFATGNHDEYNEADDSWTGRTDLSPERSEFSSAVDLDYYYIAAGRTTIGMSQDFDYFNASGNAWVALTTFPAGVHYEVHGAGCDGNGATYHIGGDQDGFENSTREFLAGWTIKTNAPNAKGYHTVAQSAGFSSMGS